MIDGTFNRAVIAVTNHLMPCGFDVAETAPSTLGELTEHMNTTGRMLVYSGASENTIFGDKEVNWAFRAWHDWHHYHEQLPFTLKGEIMVCARQKEDLFRQFGYINPKWEDLLDIEITEQVKEYVKTGVFVEDQVKFTVDKLKLKGYSL